MFSSSVNVFRISLRESIKEYFLLRVFRLFLGTCMLSDIFDKYELIDRADIIEWALNESRKCIESLRSTSDLVYERALKYYTLPVIYNVKRSKAGMFFIRKDKSFTINLRKDSESIVLVDSRDLGEDAVIHNYYLDRDGKLLAYFYTLKGADVGELVVLDVRSMDVVDRIKGSISDVVILEDGSFYYSKFFRSGSCPDGVEAPCDRVFLRRDGEDELVFGEGIPRNFFISLTTSTDGRRALVNVSYGWASNTLYAGPVDDPTRWVKILDGTSRAWFIDAVGDSYIITTYDRGGFGRILLLPHEGNVQELVPEQGTALQDAMLVGNYIIASYLVDASSHIKVFDLDGRFVQEVRFPEPASVIRMWSDGGGGLIEVRYFTKPYEVVEVGSSNGVLTFRKVLEHPKVVDAEVREGFAVSHDGTKIHYFWVGSRSGSKRVVIYGYRGFNIALTPNFMPWIPTLLDFGVDVVVANLRGGSEYGEEWHRAGMRDRKMNVFYDYIAVAEAFKSMGYRVAGIGRSNGGLLMGAVITMRPDLLCAAAIGYPVLDMLKYHKLYIGAAWIPEYGDPENPVDREYLLKYSPYHNLREGVRYPPTIIYTGLYDDRVHPAHALKFYAKLVSYGNNTCLRLETASGHAGSSPEVLAREMADVIAFLLEHMSKESS